MWFLSLFLAANKGPPSPSIIPCLNTTQPLVLLVQANSQKSMPTFYALLVHYLTTRRGCLNTTAASCSASKKSMPTFYALLVHYLTTRWGCLNTTQPLVQLVHTTSKKSMPTFYSLLVHYLTTRWGCLNTTQPLVLPQRNQCQLSMHC